MLITWGSEFRIKRRPHDASSTRTHIATNLRYGGLGVPGSRVLRLRVCGTGPKGPCTQIVYTLALKYSLSRYIGPKVYTIWVHGPLGWGFTGQYTTNVWHWGETS